MRRVVDVVVAGLGLLVLSPVLAVVAVAVLVALGPPVLFRQVRVGKDGREFRIVKFRTMRPKARPEETDEERDTRLGWLLRQVSIDELPQLWNVLAGQMSIIGPRPTVPDQVRHYTERQRGRLAVAPGLTGWAQVNGRNSISWPERIELDLWYVGHRSVALDLRIVARTVMLLVRPKGIYGPGGRNLKFPVPEDGAGGSAEALLDQRKRRTW